MKKDGFVPQQNVVCRQDVHVENVREGCLFWFVSLFVFVSTVENASMRIKYLVFVASRYVVQVFASTMTNIADARFENHTFFQIMCREAQSWRDCTTGSV